MNENQRANNNSSLSSSYNSPIHPLLRRKKLIIVSSVLIFIISISFLLLYWFSPDRRLDQATAKISKVYKHCDGNLESDECQEAINICSNDPSCQSKVADQNNIIRGYGAEFDSQIYYDTSVIYMEIKEVLQGK